MVSVLVGNKVFDELLSKDETTITLNDCEHWRKRFGYLPLLKSWGISEITLVKHSKEDAGKMFCKINDITLENGCITLFLKKSLDNR